MIFVVGGAFSQKSAFLTAVDGTVFTNKPAFEKLNKINIYTIFHKSIDKRPITLKYNSQPVFLLNPVSCFLISADFYTQNFGFFCKKELQFEKATKIPFRFRLGSLQHNDYLEGKPNAGILSRY